MKKLIQLLTVVLALAACSVAQIQLGTTTTATSSLNFTLTITPIGSGTGTITSSPDGLINCPAAGGAGCSATYSVGTSVTLNIALTGGSTFAWSGGTGAGATCSGALSCVVVMSSTATVIATFIPAASNAIPASYVGLDYNSLASSSGTPFPTTINHGTGRLWDLSGNTWSYIETANKVFSWTSVDNELAAMAVNSVKQAHMAFSKTPSFANGQPSSPKGTCNYAVDGGTGAQAPGQCFPPTDLNADGTGTNQFWRDWIGAYFAHVNQPGYLAGTGTWAGKPHAHVGVAESVNEPDTAAFFNGTFSQLVRMTQDLRCIVEDQVGVGITATGETCAQVRNAVAHGAGSSVVDTTLFPSFPANAIDTTVKTIMPSYHGGASSLWQAKCYLYCTNTVGQTSCTSKGASACNTGSAGAAATDAINWHLKYGPNTNALTGSGQPRMEQQSDQWDTAINAILQAGELAKPRYNTEGGYNGAGFTCPSQTGTATAGSESGNTVTITSTMNPGVNVPLTFAGWTPSGFNGTFWTTTSTGSNMQYTNPTSGLGTASVRGTISSPQFCYTDVDMEAAYMARNYIYQYIAHSWVEGIWYNWSSSHGGTGNTKSDAAMTNVYNQMVGAVPGSCTTSGTFNQIYTCTETLANGVAAAFVWDQSSYCSSGTCPTTATTVGGSYLTQINTETGVKTNITAHSINVGIVPIFVQAQ